MEENTRSMKVVWTVVERGQANGTNKSYWTRIGVGFVNRDGSLTLRLDAIPLSGNLQVREWEPYDRRSDAIEPAGPAPRRQAAPNDFSGTERPQRPKGLPERMLGPGESVV